MNDDTEEEESDFVFCFLLHCVWEDVWNGIDIRHGINCKPHVWTTCSELDD